MSDIMDNTVFTLSKTHHTMFSFSSSFRNSNFISLHNIYCCCLLIPYKTKIIKYVQFSSKILIFMMHLQIAGDLLSDKCLTTKQEKKPLCRRLSDFIWDHICPPPALGRLGNLQKMSTFPESREAGGGKLNIKSKWFYFLSWNNINNKLFCTIQSLIPKV